MKRTLFLLYTLCLFYITPTFSQDSQGYSFMHTNSETGLSQSNVKTVIQDSYGFIWFGTKNGLNRYDGQRVVQFDCKDYALQRSNQNISALFEDDRHILWIGTDEGDHHHLDFHHIERRERKYLDMRPKPRRVPLRRKETLPLFRFP